MPIISPSLITAPVIYPASDYQIVRYLDFTKFVSLLSKKSLFFCRLDKLDDYFEGTIPALNYELRKQWYIDTNNSKDHPLSEEEVLQSVKKCINLSSSINNWLALIAGIRRMTNLQRYGKFTLILIKGS